MRFGHSAVLVPNDVIILLSPPLLNSVCAAEVAMTAGEIPRAKAAAYKI